MTSSSYVRTSCSSLNSEVRTMSDEWERDSDGRSVGRIGTTKGKGVRRCPTRRDAAARAGRLRTCALVKSKHGAGGGLRAGQRTRASEDRCATRGPRWVSRPDALRARMWEGRRVTDSDVQCASDSGARQCGLQMDYGDTRARARGCLRRRVKGIRERFVEERERADAWNE